VTDDLIAFVRARLADDEQTARAAIASGERWRAEPTGPAAGDASASESVAARYMARWSPARVLHDVEVTRAQVDLCVQWLGDARTEAAMELAAQADVFLRLIAHRWHRHPDYRAADWPPARGFVQEPPEEPGDLRI